MGVSGLSVDVPDSRTRGQSGQGVAGPRSPGGYGVASGREGAFPAAAPPGWGQGPARGDAGTVSSARGSYLAGMPTELGHGARGSGQMGRAPPGMPGGWEPPPARRPPAAADGAGRLSRAHVSHDADDHFLRWDVCWKTDPLDHNNHAVCGMAYCSDIEGLPKLDESCTGWLITSSSSLLNLWGCNVTAGVGGEPSLQLLHSQETQLDSLDIVIETETGSLYGACSGGPHNSSCVAVHSLSPTEMLAYKFRYPLPPPGGVAAGTGSVQVGHVVSLHSMGGHLLKRCAVSYANRVAILGSGAPNQPPERAKADFPCHTAPVSVLQKSTSKPVIFTGSADGDISLWSLQEKPSAPLRRLAGHHRKVTGIEQVAEHALVTCSMDGNVMIWDLRKPEQPLHSACPDDTPVHKVAASPIGDCVALCTASNLFTMSLVNMSGTLHKMSERPLPGPYRNLAWNRQTLEVYAACADGSITVYRSAV
ncbi:unnamed protein product [Ostreobium quekettii]|uniref:Uncharacterized protein n=1 Tax=Ostreobium quekettii TaxID=121088 RepID=A0A8S1IVF7_9CHLO|nr:unnamed protein product [Ostreobium quekettii]